MNKPAETRRAEKHHSLLGLVSIFIAVITPILYFGGTQISRNLYAESHGMEPFGIWIDIVNWSILISIFLPFVGMLIAVGGMFQKNRKMLLPIFGFILSCLWVTIPTLMYFTWVLLMK